MKKVIMVVIGCSLFVAGYNYTRRQAEYTATRSTSTKSAFSKEPEAPTLKTLPMFVLNP